jgi:hypothetical protein
MRNRNGIVIIGALLPIIALLIFLLWAKPEYRSYRVPIFGKHAVSYTHKADYDFRSVTSREEATQVQQAWQLHDSIPVIDYATEMYICSALQLKEIIWEGWSTEQGHTTLVPTKQPPTPHILYLYRVPKFTPGLFRDSLPE